MNKITAKSVFLISLFIVIAGLVLRFFILPWPVAALTYDEIVRGQSQGQVLGTTAGNQWYVAPTGTASGDGSQARPWDLQTALNHPAQVKPGDTIWLLSGSYTTPNWVYYSKLKGTAQDPIKVRGEPGKRVTIDGSINTKSSYTWYMDFEVWQSKARGGVRYTECISTNPGVNYDPANPVFGDKFIHLVLHDCSANGIGGWRGSEGNEIYGNLVYFTGDYSTAENRGIYHGIYSQNVAKTGAYKEIADNIVWGGWNEGVQTYSSGDPNTAVVNYRVTGNTAFLNGALWGNTADSFFAATGRGLKNYDFQENMSYDGRGSRFSIYQGVEPGTNLVFRNNYLHGQAAAFQLANTISGEVSGNVFISKDQWWKIIGNVGASDLQINNQNVRMSNNQYYGPGNFSNNGGGGYCDFASCWQAAYGDTGSQNTSAYPTGVKVFVRPSKYETGRANVTIFNWDKQNSVSVDLSNVLKPGDQYEVRDSQNYFGPMILSGTYSGGNVSFPMNLTAIAAPVASPQPQHTSSEFNAFIVRLAGGGGAVLPPPATVDTLPPSRFAGSPSGKINSGTTLATLSLSTNEAATCKYSVSAGTAYDSMTGAFSSTGGLSHFASVSGLADGSAYAYYVRCRDQTGNTNTDDYAINFSVSAPSTPPPAPANAVYQYYEAESGTLSAPMSAAADANASNGQYIASSAADSGTANYGFNVSTAGAYVVWMRLMAPSASQDSLFVSMDGASEDVFDMAENKWSPNWQWVKVNGRGGGSPLTLNPKLFNLTAGSHTLNIRGREVGGKIDKILITNDQGFTPSDSGSQPTTPPATGDSQAPSITLQQPAAGQNVSGSIDLKASATDNIKVISFYFLIDGVKFGSNYTEPPAGNVYVVPFDSRVVVDGTHTVAARAQDAAGNVTNSPAVSFTVKNSTSTAPPPAPTPPVNQKPTGSLDGVDQAGKIFGWARDPDNLSLPVQAHIYIDKNAGTAGASPVVISASDTRSDVGAHAFNYQLPASFQDGKSHQVWVWAIDLSDSSGASNIQLPGSPKTFSLAAPAPSNPPAPTPTPPSQTSGAAAHWTFDSSDTSGNALADKSGNNRPLTLSAVNQQATGKFSQAGVFNGSSGYGSAGNVSALNLASDLTLSAWVKTSNTSRTETILGKYDLGGYESGYLLWVTAGGRLALRLGGNNLSNIYDTSLRSITDTGKVINDNQWHHVAAVIKLGQGVTFYIDGTQSSSAARAVVAAANSTSFAVGRTAPVDYGYGAYFTGELDDIKIFNSALSTADVAALYGASAPSGSGQTTPPAQTSPPAATPTAPVISNLTGNNITATTTNISWNTDIASNGQVDYGLTTNYGSQSSLINDSVKATNHSVQLVNLSPNTQYNFRVRSVAVNGLSTQTGNFTFKTLALPVVSPPASTSTPEQIPPAATTTPPATGSGSSAGGSSGGGGSSSGGGGAGGGGGSSAIVFIPPAPSASGNTGSQSASALNMRLINDRGTFYVIKQGVKQGVTNPGMLASYGFEFKDAKPASTADAGLPAGSLLLPYDGSLVKSEEDPTVYLISNGKRYGFTSAAVFTALGHKFSSVLTVTNPELQALPKAEELSAGSRAHLPGTDINKNGTIYWIGSNSVLHAYPSLEVYNSWHKDNDFSAVVPANAADMALPMGEFVSMRVVE